LKKFFEIIKNIYGVSLFHVSLKNLSRVLASPAPARALCASASISLLGSGHWYAATLFLRVLSAGTLPFLDAMEPNLAADPSGNCEDFQRFSQS
jgi:hypothetical protein